MTPERDGRSARCPKCHTELWRRSGDEWILQNRVVKLGDDGQLYAKCVRCREDVAVPFLRLAPPEEAARPIRLVAQALAGT